ncbi:MAG: C1 family peptidase [Solobacterium sp.]|nr:C1 family peptidase [Solobacterium sp.]
MNLNNEKLNALRDGYLAGEKARVVRNALTKNDLASISRRFEAENANPNIFTIDIKTMSATAQNQSGRCWIFSAMNVLREVIARRFKIKEFELSQNYVAFYDKLEKANWFMECIVNEIDEPLGSEKTRFLLESAVSDGGQWNMLVSLVKKYGICPKTAMGETYQSSHTRAMNGILNTRLRKFAIDAHKAHEEGRDSDIQTLREETMKEIYSLIASCFGLPPQEFTFEYYDSDNKAHAEYHVTPQDFYEKYLAVDIGQYVSVINGPTADKPYHKTFTVEYLGNVVDGEKVVLLNVPMEELKAAILATLKDGEPVWFGCDCGKDGDRTTGLWDDQQFDYEHTFDMNLAMTKAEMLDSRHSAMNHAMVLTGVNLVDDKPDRWKIENSWGDKVANKGYYIASDTWFDKYVYVAAINVKYLSEEAKKALDEEPVLLSPWDPFGTLAD